MTVYVDDMNCAGRVGRISSRWSHLFADTHAELEALGLGWSHWTLASRACARLRA